ncbi:MAG: hypothetical protein NTY20_02235 [Candidatus Aenigmarchaeota archaeon]|nr:hypothetical protein [Candidatus Aenigmarchaeota archaeon]
MKIHIIPECEGYKTEYLERIARLALKPFGQNIHSYQIEKPYKSSLEMVPLFDEEEILEEFKKEAELLSNSYGSPFISFVPASYYSGLSTKKGCFVLTENAKVGSPSKITKMAKMTAHELGHCLGLVPEGRFLHHYDFDTVDNLDPCLMDFGWENDIDKRGLRFCKKCEDYLKSTLKQPS